MILFSHFHLSSLKGCVWIFSVRPAVQFNNRTSSSYCHQSAYDFAFALCIAQLSLAGTIICSIGCSIICTQVMDKTFF